MTPLRTNESTLQRQIIRYCLLKKIAVLRVNGASFAEKSRYVRSYIYSSVGLKDCSAGFPDLMMFYKSKVLLAEVKVRNNGLTEAQAKFHTDIKKYCGNVYVFNDLDVAIKTIDEWLNL